MQRFRYGRSLWLGGLLIIPWAAEAAEPSTASDQWADRALIQFVQTVVEVNPRVQAARGAVEASGALQDAASRPLYNPELSLEAEKTDTDTRALGVSQTFDWGGKRQARTAVAGATRLVVEAEYLATRRAVTVELLDGLAQHQTGMDRDALAQSRRELMDEFSALAERRFDAGDLAQVELDLANLASTDARIQKATAGAGLAEARQAVRNLTSRSVNTKWPVLPTALPTLPKSTDTPESLVLALPEVLAARRQIESADAVVELRRREQRPDPTFSLMGGEEDGEALIGLNVSMPLFVRNSFKHEVRAAVIESSRAQQLADDVMQRAYSRLVSAAERYELSRGAWDDWQQIGEVSLSRQTKQLKRLWEAGELSTTDYLVQLNTTLDVQESALNLRESLWRAWFEWLGASGQVDAWLDQGSLR